MAEHKILVIDDSKVIRVRVQEMLPQGNYTVIEAKKGQEGLRFLTKEQPNLIMLDFLLPKVSGWEVFQKIQSDPKLKKIPLVLMSALKQEVAEKIPEPFDKHYFAFLEKPFEKKELTKVIKEAIMLAKIRPDDDIVEVEDGSGKIQALEAQVKKMEAEHRGIFAQHF